MGIAALLSFVACVGLWVALGFAPRLGSRLAGTPLHQWAETTAWVPLLVTAVSAALAYGTLGARPSFRAGRSSIAAGVLGGSAALIAFPTFWPCSPGQSLGWTPFLRTLELIRGSVDGTFSGPGGCTAIRPLGLQAAQLMMLFALGIIAWGAVVLIFATRVIEFRARAARAICLVTGLDDSTIGIVRRVAADLPPGVLLIAAVAGEDPRSATLAREVDAVPIELDLRSPEATERFAGRRRRNVVRGVYLLWADAADNLRALENVRTAFDRPVASSSIPARAAVRIDNPWQADDWRRRHMAEDDDWLVDAVSAVEGAARHVVRALLDADIQLVVLTDASPFELAVLNELSFEHRLRSVAEPPEPGPLPGVALTGERAGEIAEHFGAQLARFGIGDTGVECRIAEKPVEHVMSGPERSALLIAFDEDDRSSRSTFIAARKPDWTIFAWTPGAHGVGPAPLVGGLTSVGPTLEPVEGHGVDLWERFARNLHQRYVQQHLNGEPIPGDPARGPWEDLSPFTREANIRSFLATMRGIQHIGLRWATTLASSDARVDPSHLAPEDLDRLARAEHESWVAHHRAYKWRPGPDRDDRRRVHPDLVEWEKLTEESRSKDVSSVVDTLGMLDMLGFRLEEALVRRPER